MVQCTVTDEAFARDGAEWRLLHRHTDPLVHPHRLERVAALASGRLPTAGVA